MHTAIILCIMSAKHSCWEIQQYTLCYAQSPTYPSKVLLESGTHIYASSLLAAVSNTTHVVTTVLYSKYGIIRIPCISHMTSQGFVEVVSRGTCGMIKEILHYEQGNMWEDRKSCTMSRRTCGMIGNPAQ